MLLGTPVFVCGGYLNASVGNNGQSQNVVGCQAVYSTLGSGSWSIFLDPSWVATAGNPLQQYMVTIGPIVGTPGDGVSSPTVYIASQGVSNNVQGVPCVTYTFAYYNAKTALTYVAPPANGNFHFRIEKLPSL